ncbi:hypothetical protein VTJ83DRAFT_5412 [Remersonia thermophila]|uniref:Uncharacterized protein n=1 Tax=Remersonia thermophila TaxID=72144 RepID=A0ABR4D6U7_9PEZI
MAIPAATPALLPGRRISNHNANGFTAARSMAVALARLLSVTLSTAYAAPLTTQGHGGGGDAPDAEGADLWVLYLASFFLVVSGGAFAGLTIAFMGQDAIYLQVVARDPTEPQQKNAKRVHELLKKGKHWVLVTLLLSNVIVNETLPVVLDRCLGGGVAAVVGATFLIVIFGEVVPQSVCVRYGLSIGGYCAKPVLALMYLTAPLSWPTAKLLDWVLGADHGTVYKKSGLKTLVTLHQNLGDVTQRLNQDEVTIISAVLDLKEKPVSSVMTPMEDVFIMSEDTVLDEQTMDLILSAGYSRIPIHEKGNPTNFVGMLLVKILITYDPEDCKLVHDFPLATLPETRPETSCLDIVNFFQEGKSHMVLVSEYPGEDHGALGVVTLEDVIEELIGEEIIDESDVYIDVHKAIRRLTPAPRQRLQRRFSEDPTLKLNQATLKRNGENANADTSKSSPLAGAANIASPKFVGSPKTTLIMRRTSAGLDGQFVTDTVPVRANFYDIREHLKHLGPSNPALNPNKTRSTTVLVKPGGGHLSQPPTVSLAAQQTEFHPREEGDETTSLLRPHVSGKDGIQQLARAYGSTGSVATVQHVPGSNGIPSLRLDTEDQADKSTQTPADPFMDAGEASSSTASPDTSAPQSALSPPLPTQHLRPPSSGNVSAASSKTDNMLAPKRLTVRSGSITENIVESRRGVRKVVLEATGGSPDEGDEAVASSPEQPRLLSRSTLRLFSRESHDGKNGDKDKTDGEAAGESRAQQPSPVAQQAEEAGEAEEAEEEDRDGGEVLSPVSAGDGTAEEAQSPSTPTAGASGAGSAAGTGSSGGGKKKNRRKKRKGGRS